MDLIAAVNKKDYKLFGAFFRENFPFLVMFADKYVNDMDMACLLYTSGAVHAVNRSLI